MLHIKRWWHHFNGEPMGGYASHYTVESFNGRVVPGQSCYHWAVLSLEAFNWIFRLVLSPDDEILILQRAIHQNKRPMHQLVFTTFENHTEMKKKNYNANYIKYR